MRVKTEEHFCSRDLIHQGRILLGQTSSARRISEQILLELLGSGRTALYLDETPLSEPLCHQFFQILEGIKAGVPLQYLLGRATFMEGTFQVSPACFIPRVETETLVEACLDTFQEEKPLLFMDIGTGSGCIAISLTKRLPYCKMLAIDLMESALQVARRNGQSHGVSGQIFWICGDLFGGLRGVRVDAILSNPPYVPSEAFQDLPPEVHREPRVSLEGGKGGLRYYRRIAEGAPPFLKAGGFLFLEIGEGQEAQIRDFFLKTPLRLLEVRKDFAGTPRVMIFRKDLHG